MSSAKRPPSRSEVAFHYNRIRRISFAEDQENDRDVYTGNAAATSFLDLPDDENVRTYLVNAEGKRRASPTQVHVAMRDTLEQRPQDFSVLNGGIVIVARGIRVDDKGNVAYLKKPSIVNGSQTQGELARYLEEPQGRELYPVNVKFELIVTDDEDLIAEIAIARNFQNDVMQLSIASRRGKLNELASRMTDHNSEYKLQMKESDRSGDVIPTEKLLQVIAALIPPRIWPIENERNNPNKVFTYNRKATCLKNFERFHDGAKGIGKPGGNTPSTAQCKKLYAFYLDICGEAWDLYKKWKRHQGFKGCGLRAIEREEPSGKIIEVPDGMVFPILASLSAFAKQSRGRWVIPEMDSDFETELISQTKTLYMEVAGSKPMQMGKSKPCYSELFRTAGLYKRLSARSR